TPVESMQAIRNFYFKYGSRLWGEFGFTDAFNPGQDWFASFYIAIDQGPMAPMIENHRTGLCWRLFMSNPEIKALVRAFGWTDSAVDENPDAIPRSLELSQNYPNPFNPETMIHYAIPEQGSVKISVFNLTGQSVRTLVDERKAPGKYAVRWDGRNDHGQPMPSGIYIYRIRSENRVKSRRMVLMK
ncbi:T9SS type A sorting domain-containing protein, partial [bacterium]|nr:T9SS type A sorting domain-containing protein [bacterium]